MITFCTGCGTKWDTTNEGSDDAKFFSRDGNVFVRCPECGKGKQLNPQAQFFVRTISDMTHARGGDLNLFDVAVLDGDSGDLL